MEIWFGVLARKVLKRGDFTSAKDLGEKMGMFIGYFNRTMAKPYKMMNKILFLHGILMSKWRFHNSQNCGNL